MNKLNIHLNCWFNMKEALETKSSSTVFHKMIYTCYKELFNDIMHQIDISESDITKIDTEAFRDKLLDVNYIFTQYFYVLSTNFYDEDELKEYKAYETALFSLIINMLTLIEELQEEYEETKSSEIVDEVFDKYEGEDIEYGEYDRVVEEEEEECEKLENDTN